MRFFIGDTHFFHKNVIKFCKRPYNSLDEMHEDIIKRWNSVVKKGDQVWVLGDFGFCGIKLGKSILDRLNGLKYLVEGNHDRTNNKNISRYRKMGFHEVYQYKKIKINDQYFMLSHFPYYPSIFKRIWYFIKRVKLRHLEYRLYDHNVPLLCGHVHGMWKRYKNQFNVGVDVNNFTPLSEKEIYANYKT